MYLVKFSGAKSTFIEAHSAKKAIHGILPIKPILEPMCIMKPKKKRRRRSAPHWAESQVPTRCNSFEQNMLKTCFKALSNSYPTWLEVVSEMYQICKKKKGKSGQNKGSNPFQGSKKTLKPLKLQGFSLVRGTGLEPVTPCTSSMCSTSWANRANRTVIYYYNRRILSTLFYKNSVFLFRKGRLFTAYAKRAGM